MIKRKQPRKKGVSWQHALETQTRAWWCWFGTMAALFAQCVQAGRQRAGCFEAAGFERWLPACVWPYHIYKRRTVRLLPRWAYVCWHTISQHPHTAAIVPRRRTVIKHPAPPITTRRWWEFAQEIEIEHIQVAGFVWGWVSLRCAQGPTNNDSKAETEQVLSSPPFALFLAAADCISDEWRVSVRKTVLLL